MLQISIRIAPSTCLTCSNANRPSCKKCLIEFLSMHLFWQPVCCKFALRSHCYVGHLLVTMQVQKRMFQAYSEARHASVNQSCMRATPMPIWRREVLEGPGMFCCACGHKQLPLQSAKLLVAKGPSAAASTMCRPPQRPPPQSKVPAPPSSPSLSTSSPTACTSWLHEVTAIKEKLVRFVNHIDEAESSLMWSTRLTSFSLLAATSASQLQA